MCAIPHPFGPPYFSVTVWKLPCTLPSSMSSVSLHVSLLCCLRAFPRAVEVRCNLGSAGHLTPPPHPPRCNLHSKEPDLQWADPEAYFLWFLRHSPAILCSLLTFLINPLTHLYCLWFFLCLVWLTLPFLITGINSELSRTWTQPLVSAFGRIQTKTYGQIVWENTACSVPPSDT